MTWYQWLESVVGWAANIGQIATLILAAWLVWQARRRFTRIHNDNRGGLHGAMLISIGGGSIKGQVESVLNQLQADNLTIKKIVPEEIVREGQLTAFQQVDLLHEVLESKQRLTRHGVTHTYMFYRGPVALAMGVGALLDNWVPVTVFQFDRGTYTPVLVLGQGAIRGFRKGVLVENEKALLEQIMPQENESAASSQTTS